MSAKIAEPHPSASILLLRDGANGLEVLTLQRGARVGFAANMLAFPGGRVDIGDWAWRLRRRAQGGAHLTISDLAHRLAALRELFEEAGVLLAAPERHVMKLGAGAAFRVAVRYRRRVHAGRLGFAAMLERSGLLLDAGKLVPFAHWVTPAIAPKRYDTRFYLAAAPAGQRAVADGAESVRVAWRRPRDVLAAWEAGAETLMFPTRLNLMKLAKADTAAAALSSARAAPVPQVTPELALEGGRRLVIPAAAGFDLTVAEESDLDPLERAAMQVHMSALKGRPWR